MGKIVLLKDRDMIPWTALYLFINSSSTNLLQIEVSNNDNLWLFLATHIDNDVDNLFVEIILSLVQIKY